MATQKLSTKTSKKFFADSTAALCERSQTSPLNQSQVVAPYLYCRTSAKMRAAWHRMAPDPMWMDLNASTHRHWRYTVGWRHRHVISACRNPTVWTVHQSWRSTERVCRDDNTCNVNA